MSSSPLPAVAVLFSDPLFTVPARSFCKRPSPLETAALVCDPPLPRPRVERAGLEDPRALPRPRVVDKEDARPPLVELPPRWPRVDGADMVGVIDQHRKAVISRWWFCEGDKVSRIPRRWLPCGQGQRYQEELSNWCRDGG